MRNWLEVNPYPLVKFFEQLRRVYVGDIAEETTEQAAVDDTAGQPHDEANPGDPRRHLPVERRDEFRQREESACAANDLVCLGAIAAGRLPFGGDVRVSCTLVHSVPGESEPIFAGLPDAEIFVTRLSLPHEPLKFAIAASDGYADPVIWTFEFDGPTLRHAKDVV